MGESFFDSGNPLLGKVPVCLDSGTVSAPDGSTLAILTFRTASVTFSPVLTAEELRNWVTVMTGLADSMESGAARLVPATIFDVQSLGKQNGHR
jgi:hypothetical protein